MARLLTFGGLSISNGAPLNGTASKSGSRLAILAAVAASGERGLRREKLLALFWEESDEDRARNALRQALFTLRRDLGNVEVTTGGGEVRLNRAVITSDVGDFVDALAAGDRATAVALYAGPFLDGVFLRKGDAFERWADEERRRLAGEYERALERLARDASAAGQLVQAAEWWRKLAVHDLASGRVACGYMEALAAAGDRHGAMRHADLHARVVRSDLGTEPDDAVLALAARLRNGGGHGPRVVRTPPLPSAEGTAGSGLPRTDADPGPPSSPAGPPLITGFFRWHRMAIAAAALAGIGFLAGTIDRWPHSRRPVYVVPPFATTALDSALIPVGIVAADWVTQGIAQTQLADVVDFRAALARLGAKRVNELPALSSASMVVTGSITRERDSIRVDARLVRARDNSVVMQVEPARAQLANPNPAIEQIRQRVMGAIATISDQRFTSWSGPTTTPPRYDAYRHFLAGLEASASSVDTTAPRHFLAAAISDSTFLAAKIYAIRFLSDERLTDSLLQAAEAQRGQFGVYDTTLLDEALAARRGDWEGRYIAAKLGLSIAPRSLEAKLLLGNAAMGTTRYAEAVTLYDDIGREGWIERWEYFWKGAADAYHHSRNYAGELAQARAAQRLHPRSADICQLQLRPLAALGRHADLDSTATRCVSLPGNVDGMFMRWAVGRELVAHGHTTVAHSWLSRLEADARANKRMGVAAMSRQLRGDWHEFHSQQRAKVARDSTDYVTLGQYAVAAAHAGDSGAARAAEQRLATLEARHGGLSRHHVQLWRGFTLATLGERARATEILRQAVSGGVSPTWAFHFNHVYLAPLVGYPPFEALARPRG